jgi:hypothetical protein
MLQSLIGLSFAAVILSLIFLRRGTRKPSHNASARACLQRREQNEIACHVNPIGVETACSSPSILLDPTQVRQLYHSLHHIEAKPGVVPVAKEILLCSLEAADHFGRTTPTNNGIHAIDRYTPMVLREWIDKSDACIMRDFEEYSLRRANGGSRELLQRRDDATRWLRAQAPLRYVDGAWLGHISRVDTPWAHVDVVRQLWQTLSEELGDGDVEKHHTRLYAQLLQSLSPDAPDAHSPEFLDERHGANDDSVWRSAVLQLIISLFHQDFLPEILGFNLHFEKITLGMLQAMTELQELGLDATYFMLHVCIDNAATGHTAVALNAVCTYLQSVKEHQGVSMEQQAWRRIQAGYALSEGKSIRQLRGSAKSYDELQQCVVDMFESKVKAGSGAHHMCKGKIKGRRVVDWLDLNQIGNPAWWHSLTQSLSTSRTWIIPGNSDKSHFVKEISWGGRMFGAFTKSEASTLREWINRLPSEVVPLQIQSLMSDDIWQTYRSMGSCSAPFVSLGIALPALERCRAKVLAVEPGLIPSDLLYDISSSTLERSKCLPAIWFTHFCLLEKFVALPSRCGDPLGGLILRVLRAQDGICSDGYDTAVTETTKQTDSLIHNLGYQMLQYQGLSHTTSLKELLFDQPCGGLPEVISCVSIAPTKCQGMLLGMAAGFIGLHNAIAACSILDLHSKSRLRRMVVTEQAELQSAFSMLDRDAAMEFARGFSFVRQQLSILFQSQL